MKYLLEPITLLERETDTYLSSNNANSSHAYLRKSLSSTNIYEYFNLTSIQIIKQIHKYCF